MVVGVTDGRIHCGSSYFGAVYVVGFQMGEKKATVFLPLRSYPTAPTFGYAMIDDVFNIFVRTRSICIQLPPREMGKTPTHAFAHFWRRPPRERILRRSKPTVSHDRPAFSDTVGMPDASNVVDQTG